jgi:hypothetical protein
VLGVIGDRPVPPPLVPDYAQRYLSAFNALIYDRPYVTVFRVLGSPHGMPVITSEIHDMPITLATLEGYAERHGIVGGHRARFVRLITALDKEYRAVLAEQRAMMHQEEENNDGDGS